MGFLVFCGDLPLVVGGCDAPLGVTADAPLQGGEDKNKASSAVMSVSRSERRFFQNNSNRVFMTSIWELLTSSISVKFIL